LTCFGQGWPEHYPARIPILLKKTEQKDNAMNQMVAGSAGDEVRALPSPSAMRNCGGTSLAANLSRGPQPTAVIEEVLAVVAQTDPFAALGERRETRRSAEIERFEALPPRLRESQMHLIEHRRNLVAISATADAAERVLHLFGAVRPGI
jgi:hypothetical protein